MANETSEGPRPDVDVTGWRRVLSEACDPSSAHVLFALLALTCLAIYLPGLGAAELKGEEERRILPGLEMMRTGNWMQPMLGGEPYHTKPPLINWIVAGSFTATGVVSEFTARLPSILAMLGFLAALAYVPCEQLSRRVRLIAGLVFLTNVGMWEKGRLIEMEALLVCINGAACLFWLCARLNDRSAWATWPVPCLLLAAGFLLKGPAMPVFFYGLVGCVVLAERRIRDLFHPAHLVCAGLAGATFLLWYATSAKQVSHGDVSHGLAHEAFNRFIDPRVTFGEWLRIGLMSFVNFTPWIFVVPMLWRREAFDGLDDRVRRVLVGCRWGVVIPFLLIGLLPGTSARYTMPVFPMAALLLGVAFERVAAGRWETTLGRLAVQTGLAVLAVAMVAGHLVVSPTPAGFLVATSSVVLAVGGWLWAAGLQFRVGRLWGTATIAVVASLGYATFATKLLAERERYRPTAAAINREVPDGKTVNLYAPGPQEFLFYVERPLGYVFTPEEIDESVEYLAVRRSDLEAVEASGVVAGRRVEELHEFTPRIEGDFRLVRLSPATTAAAADDATRR